MRVRAKKMSADSEADKVVGFFNNKRIREREEFEIEDEGAELKTFEDGQDRGKKIVMKRFSPAWMEKVEDDRPKRGKVMKSSSDEEVI